MVPQAIGIYLHNRIGDSARIKTYPNAKPVRQCLHAVNPRKAPAIKAEIEKLLKGGFIYPVPLTEWVSNPVLADKKQGAIRICTDCYGEKFLWLGVPQ